MATPQPYVMLIAVGFSPAVLTETVFAIYERNRDVTRVPATVHVITTGKGEAFVRALLLGEDMRNPLTSQPFEDAADRWTPFCTEVLGLPNAVPLQIHVPTVDEQPLQDVLDRGDDTRFANLCYERVRALTGDDALPLIGSIAGGRKTMSAHLMTAFSVYGRTEDRLTHILMADTTLERSRDFFYPVPGTPEYARQVAALHLVEIPFPRLRGTLGDDVLDVADEADDNHFEALRDALQPQALRRSDVDAVELKIRDREAPVLVFKDASGEVLARCPLTPKHAATLGVFAELHAQHAGPVPAPAFYAAENRSTIAAQRRALAEQCGRYEPLAPWHDTTDVSQALSDLRNRLHAAPIAERMFAIEGITGATHRYDWPGAPPPFAVDLARPTAGRWPFKHLTHT
ncbi:CRISPR-associated ring nuclease Csm6 [Salisaeta longa]|uniref:CRISPR-associated ring nuclease Csm6 n=1 Tax=Salisaeta longa TaxID=503170 RepID=UPI0003B509DB|nr:CRISPR-associated ring nuclease Csm6 [Salisaeta longa]